MSHSVHFVLAGADPEPSALPPDAPLPRIGEHVEIDARTYQVIDVVHAHSSAVPDQSRTLLHLSAVTR